jgi:phosphate transport system permease protein
MVWFVFNGYKLRDMHALLRIWVDRLAARIFSLFAWFSVFLLFIILAGLILKSLPVMRNYGFADLLFSADWKPMQKQFGFLPFIVSTLYVTVTALVFALPACTLASLYLVEYARPRFTNAVLPVIDILAGIPSVIYGIWGILVIVPFVRNQIAPLFHADTTGYSILSGGLVLAVMVFPLMINLLVEVLRTVPRELREASLSLGTTRWETSLFVVLRKALPGIFAGCYPGFFPRFRGDHCRPYGGRQCGSDTARRIRFGVSHPGSHCEQLRRNAIYSFL